MRNENIKDKSSAREVQRVSFFNEIIKTETRQNVSVFRCVLSMALILLEISQPQVVTAKGSDQ